MKRNPSQKEKILSYSNRMLIGLSISLAFVFMAFEYTSIKTNKTFSYQPEVKIVDELELPPFRIEKKKLTPPEPKQNTDQMKIVDELKPKEIIEVEPIKPKELKSTSTIDINPDLYFPKEKVVEENHPRSSVEVFPHTNNCKGLEGDALKDCSMRDLVNLIKKEFKTPGILKEIGGRQGALMSFIINQDGEVEEIKVVQETHSSMGKAAANAIKKLPSMTPPSHHGKKVKLIIEVPIVVNLRD